MTADEELEALFRKGVEERVAKIIPSKPLTMDPRPAPLMRPSLDNDAETETGARGPIETLGKLGPLHAASQALLVDKTDPVAMEQQRKGKLFMGTVGGMVGGGAADALVGGLPVVEGMAAARGVRALGAGAIRGAAGGGGATIGGSLAGEGELPTLREMGAGAAMGAGLGVAGAALGNLFGGASARADRNIIKAGGEGMRAGTYENFFGSREAVARTLRSDRELHGAMGAPEKMLAQLETKVPAAKADQVKVMDAADAKNGRIPVAAAMTKVFDSALKELQAIGGAEANAAADAANRVAKQFRSGLGADPGHPPSTADVQKFMSDQVGSKLNPRPLTNDDKEINKAAAVLYAKFRDLVDGHVAAADPGLGTELKALNEKLSTYSILRDGATQAQLKASQGIAPRGDNKGRALGATVGGGLGTAIGEALGGHQGAFIGGGIGSAAGAVTGPAVIRAASSAGAATTRALASPAGQAAGEALAPAVAHSAHVIVPQIIDHIRQGNRRAALAVASRAVYDE